MKDLLNQKILDEAISEVDEIVKRLASTGGKLRDVRSELEKLDYFVKFSQTLPGRKKMKVMHSGFWVGTWNI